MRAIITINYVTDNCLTYEGNYEHKFRFKTQILVRQTNFHTSIRHQNKICLIVFQVISVLLSKH